MWGERRPERKGGIKGLWRKVRLQQMAIKGKAFQIFRAEEPKTCSKS